MTRYLMMVLMGFVIMMINAGCSLVATKPTIWRPDVSPHVRELSMAKDNGWRRVGSFSVGGIGDVSLQNLSDFIS